MTITSTTGIWDIGDNWPWPQVIFTSYYNLAVAIKANNAVALYELTNIGNAWTATEKIVIGTKSTILSVDVADFITYYVLMVQLTTGNAVYVKNVATGAVSNVASSTIPAGVTCCNFIGQLIIGGAVSSSAPWVSLSPCNVIWGEVGSIGINPSTYVSAGYAPMPWDENGNGKVFKVLPLGNIIRVYGDRGVVSLIPYGNETTTGFGIGLLETPGVLSKDAIDGDEGVHGFVDSNYNWNLVVQGKKTVAGYSKFMKLLTGRVLVRYDRAKKKFFISDGVTSFVFTKYGMYSTHQSVTSIGRYKGTQCGFVVNGSDNNIRLSTTSVAFADIGLHTVESVALGINYNTDTDISLYGALSTKYTYNDSFIQLPWTPLNPQGIFVQKTTGREFKVHMQGEYSSSGVFDLSSIVCKIKYCDKRNRRGPRDVN